MCMVYIDSLKRVFYLRIRLHWLCCMFWIHQWQYLNGYFSLQHKLLLIKYPVLCSLSPFLHYCEFWTILPIHLASHNVLWSADVETSVIPVATLQAPVINQFQRLMTRMNFSDFQETLRLRLCDYFPSSKLLFHKGVWKSWPPYSMSEMTITFFVKYVIFVELSRHLYLL